MRTATALLLMSMLLTRDGSAAQDKKKPGEKKPLVVALTKTPIRKGALRPGFDLKAEIPAQAYHAKIGSDTLTFVDLDGNEQIVAGTDGLAMLSTGPFVVLIPETILLKTGQFKLGFEGTKQVTLTEEDLGAAQKYVAEASVYTELRMRGGLRPAYLDPQMCANADKHTDYLKLNGIHLQDGGKTNSHLEDESKPGYSAEGAAAGLASNIFKGRNDLRRSMTSWYSTPYHGSAMLMPGTDKVGVTTKNGVAMLYLTGHHMFYPEPYVHPPDGAIDIPTAFGNGEDGENPSPVPDTSKGRGCGFPIYILLHGKYMDTESAEIVDGAGRPVKGTWSTPTKPANPTARPENNGCVFFIPAKPFQGNTLHRVTIKFPGADKPLTWSFTTGK